MKEHEPNYCKRKNIWGHFYVIWRECGKITITVPIYKELSEYGRQFKRVTCVIKSERELRGPKFSDCDMKYVEERKHY
jgi:hypothetical protein